MKNKICSIILARGASKGLKNKNILNFCGKPLILWTIEACISSGIEDVYVSSDSDKILKLSRDYGAKIIKRPKKLSQDNSSSESCWLHAINYLKQQNLNYEIIVAPQVTSPIRKNNDIKRALKQNSKNAGGKVTLYTLNYIKKLIVAVELKDSISHVNRKPSSLLFSMVAWTVFEGNLDEHTGFRWRDVVELWDLPKGEYFTIDYFPNTS